MDWSILLSVILQFLGPILRDWLDSLLKRSAAQLAAGKAPTQYATGASAEATLWSCAESLLDAEADSLAWYQWVAKWHMASRKRFFAAARASAVRRAGSFYTSALSGQPVRGLTAIEFEAISQAG